MDEQLPGVEAYSGKLYELPESTITKIEVLSELEFCALQIREHHGRFARSLVTTLEEARDIGAYLNKAHSLFAPEQIRNGEFRDWFEENCSEFMSRTRGRAFQRLEREWHKLGRLPRPPQSIKAALGAIREIDEPTEERTEPELQEDDVLELEAAEEQQQEDDEPVMVVLPGGKEVTPEEAKEFYESDFERLAKLQWAVFAGVGCRRIGIS